jgi:uncharacterized membrane protein
VTSYAFANPLPWWGVALAVLACGGVAWFAYARFGVRPFRRNTLIALRFLTLVLIVVCLMRPIRTSDEGLRDAVVPVLVDVSRSMGLADAGDGATRLDRARDLLARDLMPALNPHFQVDLLSFGDRVAATTPDSLDAKAGHSDLGAALSAARERYRGRAVPGIVIISDGGDTGPGTAPSDTPVFAVGVGSPVVARDREVLSVTAAEAVFDESRVDLAVSAVSHGYGVDPIPLQLLENGKPIEVRRVTPTAAGAPVRTVFHVSPARGVPTVYSVEVPAASAELTTDNNVRRVLVHPPSRVRHVLFVEGAPGFEHSFVKRAWSLDPALDVDAIVRKGKNEQGSDTFYIQASQSRTDALSSGFPERADELFQYDVVVLANVDATQLTRDQLDLTRGFVGKRGGGLLVLGGRSFGKGGLGETTLDEALPLSFSGHDDGVLPASTRGTNRVSLTPTGEAHPIMQLAPTREDTIRRWDGVPALAATSPLGGARPGASILAVTGGAGGGSRALVAVQRYGHGRSMIFTGEASWRWRMMLPSTDRSYDTFWRQSLRWLALPAEDPIAIEPPIGMSPGETAQIRTQVRNAAFDPQPDAAVELRLTDPDGKAQTVRAEHGISGDAAFVAPVHVGAPGVYRLTANVQRGGSPLGSAETSMLVGGADLEMTDPRLNLQVLDRVALGSGGRVVAPQDFHTIVDALRARLPAARLAVTHDVWHTGWSLGALILLLGTEWILRRRWGLR